MIVVLRCYGQAQNYIQGTPEAFLRYIQNRFPQRFLEALRIALIHRV